MYNKMLLTLVILSSLPSGGCDGTEVETDEGHAVLFDAVELDASRQNDPNQWFLVDISDGIVNYFDESEMDIDFTNFLFYCPTMDAPMPLEVVAPELLVDRPEVWSVGFEADSDEPRFRSGCITICQNGSDCYVRCPAELPEPPEPAPPAPKPF